MTGVTDQHEPAPPVAKKSNSLWKDFDEEEAETVDSQKNVTGPVSAIEVEMNLYRETARVNRFEDPMKWWRQHSNMMPSLQGWRRDILVYQPHLFPVKGCFLKLANSFQQDNQDLKNQTLIYLF